MTVDDQFIDGFQFALIVLSSMGHNPGIDAIAAQLTSVVNGDLTLSPSPPEAIRSIEAEYGVPLPEHLKNSVHRLLGNRREMDEARRQTCLAVLKQIGFGVSPPPA